jgi:hypothetical protein
VKNQIPAYTITNLCAAVGDVVRASGAWGKESADGTDALAEIQLVMVCVQQLLTVCLQREPTAAEMESVIT